ncbi:MAG: hypothetical protein HYS17_02715 [Micavibrio aeruginosavorus]|uniref:Uncharacterized protein n=1 Tax=Micavibrio aeruginosavorus TaxID=349221 RepID=A0A7T5R397_9BACT|nr:MAG: hypothetical protein HYS17_02715 [Micavibrio aeruginosavorus]
MSYNGYSNKQNIIPNYTDTNKYLLDSYPDWNMFLDKLSLTVSRDYFFIDDTVKAFNEAYELNKDMKSRGIKNVEYIISKKGSGYYQAEYKIHFTRYDRDSKSSVVDWNNHVLIQLNARCKGAKGIRIEYNPGKLTKGNIDSLNELISSVCDYTFAQLIALGTVTRIDVTCDVRGLILDKLLVHVVGKRKLNIHTNNGLLESCYFGTPAADYYCVYQKNIQDLSVTGRVVRFEARLKPNMPLSELHSLPNPFIKMRVYDVHRPTGLSGSVRAYYRWFISQSRQYGLRKTLDATSYGMVCSYVHILTEKAFNFIDADKWEEVFAGALRKGHLYKLKKPKIPKKYLLQVKPISTKDYEDIDVCDDDIDDDHDDL